MKADTAYSKTREINLDEKSGHYVQCMEKINRAIDDGEYTTSVYFDLEPEVKERLENENYVVEENWLDTDITWNFKKKD